MGMAASQARLLSITSRMADNELRSQIINNSKMRLATESSKVSEEYINALNSATMMMSNYDTAGESQYQKLSFNSLTSYSSYNNQYGLVNANGKLLVSERDAANYRNVLDKGGDLDDFLAVYGLEYKSTYFTSETLGAEQINFEDINKTFTIQELEEMYYGNDDKGILSYNNALQSSEYVNYADYYDQFLLAQENYKLQAIDTINSSLGFSDSNSTWSQKYTTYVTNGGSDNISDMYNNGVLWIKNQITSLVNSNKLPTTTPFYNEMMSYINSINYQNGQVILTGTDECTVDPDTGNIYMGSRYELDDGSIVSELLATKNDDGTYTISTNPAINDYFTNDGTSINFNGQSSITVPNFNNPFTYTVVETDDEGNIINETYTYKYDTNTEQATTSWTATNSEFASVVSNLFLMYKAGVVDALNLDAYANLSNPVVLDAKNKRDEAFSKLTELLFGKNNNFKLDDASILASPEGVLNWAYQNGGITTSALEIIEKIYILDTLFNVYGEPSAGWIDVNNPDENADAKVQWYTNLFNRMQQGYSVLEDGLASSNEWIEFALESGLVTMEQVDKNNNWTSTIYTNCSDITEVTDDTAVTIAEAEYNKAMNNIENKDKRFDMELKNIDTEHNSLQTEYDSVKSVIDKNIERSFKIYS